MVVKKKKKKRKPLKVNIIQVFSYITVLRRFAFQEQLPFLWSVRLGLIVALPISTYGFQGHLGCQAPSQPREEKGGEGGRFFNRAGLEVGMYTSAHIPLEITWSPLRYLDHLPNLFGRVSGKCSLCALRREEFVV